MYLIFTILSILAAIIFISLSIYELRNNSENFLEYSLNDTKAACI